LTTDDPNLGPVVVSEEAIRDRTKELGARIAVDYAARPPLLVGVLKGAFVFMDLDSDLTGRHVLVVEDIVDSGLTLAFLLRNLAARHPASLAVCALLVKELEPSVDELAYVGFRIPRDFVVGYGLDVAERYRNLSCVRRYDGPMSPG